MGDDSNDDLGEVNDGEVNDIAETLSSSVWVLIPLTALMIPILAISDGVAGGRAIPVAIAVCMVLAVAAVLARMLMTQRHVLRMRELRAERAIAVAEAQQLNEANQVIENNAALRELRNAVAAETTPTQQPQDIAQESRD